MTPRHTGSLRRVVVALSLLSGAGGIAYEVLFTRLWTTYLGDMIQVAGGILATFLLGIGIGSLVAHRFTRWLWAVETGLGAYAIAMALAVPAARDWILAHVTPLALESPAATVAILVCVLAPPSLLIGFSIPLFSEVADALRKESGAASGFSWIYAIYNAGAGVCVIAMELWLVPELGVSASITLLGAVNLALGLTLLFLQRLHPAWPASEPPRQSLGGSLPVHILAALFLSSALSGVFQLAILRIASLVLGPFHLHFAMLLALTLTSLSLGTWLVERYRPPLDRVLGVGALVTLSSLAPWRIWIDGWPHVSRSVGDARAPAAGKARAPVDPATAHGHVFGATVPAAVNALAPSAETVEGKTARGVGLALAASSFGNCAGYVAAVVLVLVWVPLPALMVLLGGALAATGWWLAIDRRARAPELALALAAGVAAFVAWPPHLAALAHADFASPEQLEKTRRRIRSLETFPAMDGQLTLVETTDGQIRFQIDGYRSVVANTNKLPNARETLVGVAPVLYAPQRKHALVLGTGTGVTAGAVASFFERVTVVEISPAAHSLLPRFAEYNYGLHERTNVTFVVADGLAYLASTDEQFDVIVNTTTSPMYFSSSKLYSLDFFQLARSRLAPGGIYALWFDGRMPPPGDPDDPGYARARLRRLRLRSPHGGLLRRHLRNPATSAAATPRHRVERGRAARRGRAGEGRTGSGHASRSVALHPPALCARSLAGGGEHVRSSIARALHGGQ